MDFILIRFEGGQVLLAVETPFGRIPIAAFGGIETFAKFTRMLDSLRDEMQRDEVPEAFKRAFEIREEP